MKIINYILIMSLTMCAQIVAYGDVTYTTSTGAVFTQMQGPSRFGSGWRDPNGVVWGKYVVDTDNEPIKPDKDYVVVDSMATRACSGIGGVLPIEKQYEGLVSSFDHEQTGKWTAQGKRDVSALFPDMFSHEYFWTATVSDYYNYSTTVLIVKWGMLDDQPGWRRSKYSVRCVTR